MLQRERILDETINNLMDLVKLEVQKNKPLEEQVGALSK